MVSQVVFLPQGSSLAIGCAGIPAESFRVVTGIHYAPPHTPIAEDVNTRFGSMPNRHPHLEWTQTDFVWEEDSQRIDPSNRAIANGELE